MNELVIDFCYFLIIFGINRKNKIKIGRVELVCF